MMDIKRFVRNILLFIPFSLIVYLALLFVWGSTAPNWTKSNLNYRIGSYGHLFSRLKEVKKTKNIDILFLGSSHAYRGFDPRIFAKRDLRVFNLGSSAQTPLQTRVLLDRYLDQLKPELVIYEVFPATFSIDGVESSLDVIANDRNDNHSLKMALHLNNAKTYNTLIYALIRDMTGLNETYIEPVVKDGDTYISGGYVEREMANSKSLDRIENEWKLDGEHLKEFAGIIKMLKERNIMVMLVYAPVSSGLYNASSNREMFDRRMNHYGNYYNFNERLQLTDSLHFYDSHHLNQVGVEVFNKELLDVIQDKKLVKQAGN